MGNLVEFILRLKEDMSSGMARVAASTRTAMTTATNYINRTRNAATAAGRGINSIPSTARSAVIRTSASIATLERALRRLEYRRSISLDTSQITRANRDIERVKKEIERLKNLGQTPSQGSGRSGGGLLGWFGGVRGIAAGLGLTAILGGAGKVAGMGMEAGAQRTSFETMAGKQEGGQLFNDLTKFANDSIFGKEVYKNSQTMLAFGANAKEIMPDLKMLGDISLGNKERLGSLSLAYSQIRAAGRLMGQDLLQLVNAGFNPLQIISEKTGKSMGDLKQMMEDGQISFAMVKRAFQDATGPGGRFFDMTNRIAETPFGKWEALKGQISGIGVEFGTAMLPLTSAFIDTIEPFVAQLPGLIEKVGPSFSKFSKEFLPALTTVGNILFNVIPPALKLIASVGTILLKVLGPILKFLEMAASAFGHLFDGIADTISDATDKVTNRVDKMMGSVASAITESKPAITGAMAGVINSGEMDSLFQEAGRKHGALYAQELQDQVGAIKLTMPQQEVLASWATSNGKPISQPGSTDPYGDYLSKVPTGQEILDMAPAILRQVGLKQGRGAFEKKVDEYKRTKGFADFSEKEAAVVRAGIERIAAEQRNYLTKLANGTGPQAATGYESLAAPGTGKGKGKGKLGSTGMTHSGPQNITININKEMIGKLDINSYNIKEGVGEMEGLIEEALHRILESINTED